ncbi:transmembrane protein, putative [Medicago truncatula]|uniref:Transmembrane protein, putative n=1 Tax=Medicago truncatula TaxID=3880 RepID=G7K5L9_MEDTR|nr:transmembrane protein, putative [Medicago truncatula]
MFHLLVLDCSIWVVNLNFFGCLAILDFLVSVKLVLNNFIDCFGITKGDGMLFGWSRTEFLEVEESFSQPNDFTGRQAV